jgi:hypothetical protein
MDEGDPQREYQRRVSIVIPAQAGIHSTRSVVLAKARIHFQVQKVKMDSGSRWARPE